MMCVIVKQASDPRGRMVRSAAVLFRERGLDGTSFRDVIEHSGAPRGSIYHHFPGGKAQLAAEAVDYAGELSAAAIGRGDALAAVRSFLQIWRDPMIASDYRAGCPIVAVATAAPDDAELIAATGRAFARIRAALVDAGVTPARATLIIAAIEGAVILCRAERSIAPLEDVEAELEALLGAG